MSGFGIFLLTFTGLLLLVGLIQALAAWDRFLEQGGFRTALDRLAYVNREPKYVPSVVVAPPVATTPKLTLQPVAEPTTTCNDELEVAELATLQCLARLYIESRERGFQDGKLPETRAIEICFGCKRSGSDKSEYKRLLTALRAEVARLDPGHKPEFTELDEQSRPALITKARAPIVVDEEVVC